MRNNKGISSHLPKIVAFADVEGYQKVMILSDEGDPINVLDETTNDILHKVQCGLEKKIHACNLVHKDWRPAQVLIKQENLPNIDTVGQDAFISYIVENATIIDWLEISSDEFSNTSKPWTIDQQFRQSYKEDIQRAKVSSENANEYETIELDLLDYH